MTLPGRLLGRREGSDGRVAEAYSCGHSPWVLTLQLSPTSDPTVPAIPGTYSRLLLPVISRDWRVGYVRKLSPGSAPTMQGICSVDSSEKRGPCRTGPTYSSDGLFTPC